MVVEKLVNCVFNVPPKGTIQPSIYDGDKKRILNLLRQGKSTYKINILLNYGSYTSLLIYLKKRGYVKTKNNEK